MCEFWDFTDGSEAAGMWGFRWEFRYLVWIIRNDVLEYLSRIDKNEKYNNFEHQKY
jgi:hypothetical protein